MKYFIHIDLLELTSIYVIATSTLVHMAIQKYPDILKSRPDRCVGHPDLLNRFCCTIPPFFTQESARSCGGVAHVFYRKKNVTGLLRRSYTCQYWYCILNRYELISSKGYVDNEKYFVHLDLWVTLNPSFNEVMLDAKVECKTSHRYYLPLSPCEFPNMNGCIRNYLKVKCPITIQTKECIQQKKFFDECGNFFT